MFDKEKMAWNGIPIAEINLMKMEKKECDELLYQVESQDDGSWFELIGRLSVEQSASLCLTKTSGSYEQSGNPLEVFWTPSFTNSVFPKKFMPFDFGDHVDFIREMLDDEVSEVSMRRAVTMRDALQSKLDELNAAIKAAER